MFCFDCRRTLKETVHYILVRILFVLQLPQLILHTVYKVRGFKVFQEVFPCGPVLKDGKCRSVSRLLSHYGPNIHKLNYLFICVCVALLLSKHWFRIRRDVAVNRFSQGMNSQLSCKLNQPSLQAGKKKRNLQLLVFGLQRRINVGFVPFGRK